MSDQRLFSSLANLIFKCLVCLPEMKFYRGLQKFKFWVDLVKSNDSFEYSYEVLADFFFCFF